MYRLAWLAAAILASCSGCSIIEAGAHTLVIEPLQYCGVSDKYVSHLRHQRMASIAWDQLQSNNDERGFSEDFAQGFRDGFTDYLNAGGTGEPPPVPPRHYWKGKYQSLQGHQAIQDWYAGFRLGAEVAIESGWRDFIVIPTASLSGVTQDPATYTSPQLPAGELLETPPSGQPIRNALPPRDSTSINQAKQLAHHSIEAGDPPLVERFFATASVQSAQTTDHQQKPAAAYAVATAPISQHNTAAAASSELPHVQNQVMLKRLPPIPAAESYQPRD